MNLDDWRAVTGTEYRETLRLFRLLKNHPSALIQRIGDFEIGVVLNNDPRKAELFSVQGMGAPEISPQHSIADVALILYHSDYWDSETGESYRSAETHAGALLKDKAFLGGMGLHGTNWYREFEGGIWCGDEGAGGSEFRKQALTTRDQFRDAALLMFRGYKPGDLRVWSVPMIDRLRDYRHRHTLQGLLEGWHELPGEYRLAAQPIN